MTEAEWSECNDTMRILEYLRGQASPRKTRLLMVAACRDIWGEIVRTKRSKWETDPVEIPEWELQALSVAEQLADGLIPRDEYGDIQESQIAPLLPELNSISYQSLSGITSNGCLLTLLAIRYAVGFMVMSWGAPDGDDLATSCCLTCTKAEDYDLLSTYAVYCENHFEVLFDDWLKEIQSDIESAIGSYEDQFDELYTRNISFTVKPEEDEEIKLHVREAMSLEEQYQAQLIRDIFGNPFRPVSLNPSWRTSTVLSLAQGIYEERAFDRMPILADALQDAGCDSEDMLNHCRQPGEHVRGCWVVDLILSK